MLQIRLTVIFKPVNIGTSRVGYLNQTSFNSIFAPPSIFWICGAEFPVASAGSRKLNILFAAADACAISIAILATKNRGSLPTEY